DVVLPAGADWCEAEGTVTNSERRVQRVRPALRPPGDARTDLQILVALAERFGHDWSWMTPEAAWDELRRLSPMHGGMSWDRLEEHGGLRWPCPTEDHPGTKFLHGRLWQDPVEGPRAPFIATEWVPPVDTLSDEFPYRLTTGRHLDSYNTGVQTGAYSSPRRSAGMLEVSSHDATRLRIRDGDPVVVTSRRGSIRVPARVGDGLRGGLVFMTLHHPELADVNLLTIDAWDPKSGTSEFKATAVRIEPATEPVTVDA
ncbi:MAG: molybdopterin dinucleotide binding domain-containing protein, partial [Nitriliruptoraceae bacterium]